MDCVCVEAAEDTGGGDKTTKPDNKTNVNNQQKQRTGLTPADAADPAPWTRENAPLSDGARPADLSKPFELLVAEAQSFVCPPPGAFSSAGDPEPWAPEFDARPLAEIEAASEAALGLSDEQRALRRRLLEDFWDKGLEAPRDLFDAVFGPSILPGGKPPPRMIGDGPGATDRPEDEEEDAARAAEMARLAAAIGAAAGLGGWREGKGRVGGAFGCSSPSCGSF